MSISVVIPSRLDIDPRSPYGDLFLDRALASIRAQTVAVQEVCVGIRAGQSLPKRILDAYPDWDFRVAAVERPGQPAAANEAARLATGDYLAFLEDDDTWEPKRLSFGLMTLEKTGARFVSSNQLQKGIDGHVLGINDYPTPSGWLLERAVWLELGAFDEAHRWHLDSDFLGKLNKCGIKRAHLVEQGAEVNRSPFLQRLANTTSVATISEAMPPVVRLVNPRGGMSTIGRDASVNLESRRENQMLIERYGVFPV